MMERDCKSKVGYTVALALFLAGLIALSGCTIRTRAGTEYKILDRNGENPVEETQPTKEQQTTEPQSKDPFAELSPSEQKDLATKEAEPKKATSMAPKEKADDQLDGTEAEQAFPTKITGRPKKTLPLQTQLYPVPASAEVLLFDPEKKHRYNRKAALDLTDQGRKALEAGKVELAISKFQKAISVDSKCGHAYFYFARARFVQQDWGQVIALTEKAALHFSKDPVFLSRSHLLKAQALANQKRYVPAMAACENAIDADSTNVQAKLLRNRLRSLY